MRGSAYAEHMPEPEEFYRAATDYAGQLVKLAYTVTGDVEAAQVLAESALVAVLDTWPRARRLGLPLAARRALRAGLPRSASTGGSIRDLQLQDVRRRDHAEPPAAEADLDARLWRSMEELTPRQRLHLGLRFGANLSPVDTGRVLQLPDPLARRAERLALQELALAADLDVDRLGTGDELDGGAPFESAVRRALGAQIIGLAPRSDLLERVRSRAGSRPARSVSRRVLGVAAGTVVALAAGLGYVGSRGGPQLSDAAVQSAAPAGTRLVGYHGIAVAVPANWRLSESGCGRVAALGPAPGQTPETGCTGDAGGSSVTFVSDLFDPLGPMSPLPKVSGRAAGHTVLTTALISGPAGYRQTVLVPRARFVMTIRSQDSGLVTAIAGSIRGVPAGFTVVPVCESLPVRDAVAALASVGLSSKIEHTSSLSARYGEPPVTFQDQPSGAVVREGSAVALTIPSF